MQRLVGAVENRHPAVAPQNRRSPASRRRAGCRESARRPSRGDSIQAACRSFRSVIRLVRMAISMPVEIAATSVMAIISSISVNAALIALHISPCCSRPGGSSSVNAAAPVRPSTRFRARCDRPPTSGPAPGAVSNGMTVARHPAVTPPASAGSNMPSIGTLRGILWSASSSSIFDRASSVARS